MTRRFVTSGKLAILEEKKLHRLSDRAIGAAAGFAEIGSQVLQQVATEARASADAYTLTTATIRVARASLGTALKEVDPQLHSQLHASAYICGLSRGGKPEVFWIDLKRGLRRRREAVTVASIGDIEPTLAQDVAMRSQANGFLLGDRFASDFVSAAASASTMVGFPADIMLLHPAGVEEVKLDGPLGSGMESTTLRLRTSPGGLLLYAPV